MTAWKKVVTLLYGLAILIVIYVAIYFATKGRVRPIRRIAGLDAIDEAVGRAVEMGGTVHWTHGLSISNKLFSKRSNEIVAGVSILGYVAQLCARLGARLVCTVGTAELLPIVEENLNTAFRAEGKPELFNQEDIKYYPEQSYTIGGVGVMEGENVKANIFAGAFAHEAIIFAECGYYVGAFQVACVVGTAYAFLPACDYCMIGEELLASGAYLSKDPIQLACFSGQDFGKILAIATIIVGLIATAAGLPFSTWMKT
jgi:hypothetical protein